MTDDDDTTTVYDTTESDDVRIPDSDDYPDASPFEPAPDNDADAADPDAERPPYWPSIEPEAAAEVLTEKPAWSDIDPEVVVEALREIAALEQFQRALVRLGGFPDPAAVSATDETDADSDGTQSVTRPASEPVLAGYDHSLQDLVDEQNDRERVRDR